MLFEEAIAKKGSADAGRSTGADLPARSLFSRPFSEAFVLDLFTITALVYALTTVYELVAGGFRI